MMRNYTFRLKPGQDLFDSISLFNRENDIQAGCILTVVGSLAQVELRFANQETMTTLAGYFEIVSLTGTLSIHGSHLHLSVSGEDGRTLGGHFESGCKIYTTAEIVIAVFEDVVYRREFSEDSGYEELAIHNRLA